MNISSISINSKNTSFGHNNPWADSPYNKKERYIIAGTTALGVATSMALLAKHKGYSLNPAKMFKNYKNSYFNKVEYDEVPVIAMGAGSCLGGLAGGFLIDKDKENRKAKMREALLQIANISVPIVFVVYAAKFGKKFGKLAQAAGGIAGLFAGVFTANLIGNKINEKIFNRGKGRPVQATDFSAHLDDFCVAAEQIYSGSLVHAISRLVPFALMVAGNEVGNTCTANVDK